MSIEDNYAVTKWVMVTLYVGWWPFLRKENMHCSWSIANWVTWNLPTLQQ